MHHEQFRMAAWIEVHLTSTFLEWLTNHPSKATMGPKDGLRNRQDSEKEPLMKTDSIYWENLSQHESQNLRTWLGMTWAEDCETKPKLPWIDSTSFKKARQRSIWH